MTEIAVSHANENEVSEGDRMLCLERLEILDTAEEAPYDRITGLVCRIFSVPMSTISFLDGHRQWFKSHPGISARSTPRTEAICYHAVRQGAPLIVPDAFLDSRFATNPGVTGEPHIRFYAGFPVHHPSGVCVGTLCAMDTKPRELHHAEIDVLNEFSGAVSDLLRLRLLSTVDALTGACSRRGFMAEAGRALGRAMRHEHSLSIIVFDLDHFKSINDNHGHAGGDQILSDIVKRCQQAIRSTDTLGRLGGEEFAVLLPHTDVTGALTIAEELRRAIEDELFYLTSGPVRVTASFGTASASGSTFNIEGIIERADEALYRAKRSGRNRCAVEEMAVLPALRRVLKAGKVVFNSGNSIIDCTIRQISEVAASIEVFSTAGIPDEFYLQIALFSRQCRVVGKSAHALEVSFGQ